MAATIRARGGGRGERMWWFAGFGLSSYLLAALGTAATPQVSVVKDDRQPNHCHGDAVAFAYLYVDDSLIGSAGDQLETYEFADYQSCQHAVQIMAINTAGRSCTGVSYGTRGVAYSRPLWDVYWNDVLVETVLQQYDCGDVSVY